jgi:ABC-2 type transport system permease protein
MTIFGSSTVAVAEATDMSEGVIDRFRTLPIIRSSVLLGRTISTTIIGLPGLVVMISCGLLVGWRPEAGLGHAVAGFALLSLFGFAMSWIGALIGMVARSPQSADGLSMLPAFLLGFVSNVFVPTAGMPTWLRVFAEWNPVSAVVAAARGACDDRHECAAARPPRRKASVPRVPGPAARWPRRPGSSWPGAPWSPGRARR